VNLVNLVNLAKSVNHDLATACAKEGIADDKTPLPQTLRAVIHPRTPRTQRTPRTKTVSHATIVRKNATTNAITKTIATIVQNVTSVRNAMNVQNVRSVPNATSVTTELATTIKDVGSKISSLANLRSTDTILII
jgi:hypothetical protein